MWLAVPAGRARNNELGPENLDYLAALIDCAAQNRCNASIGLRSGGRDLDHFAFDVQDVARARRGRPIEVSSCSNEATRQGQAGLDVETHRKSSRVPAACGQSLEEGVLGRVVVGVKWLRVELGRERLDLRFLALVKRCPTYRSSR